MCPNGCLPLRRNCEKKLSSLCWNIQTPVTGFCHRYALLSCKLILKTCVETAFVHTEKQLPGSFLANVNQQQTMSKKSGCAKCS